MNPPTRPDAYTPSEENSDRRLVERMRGGDDRALGQFYDRWARVVYALILQIVHDQDDADDVLEATFYQAWREAGRYAPDRGTVPTWILMIARSRALDRVRAKRRRREEPLTPSATGNLDNVAAEAPSADVAEVADQRSRVAEAVRTLPAEQREVVELAYFGGLSQSEIADKIGQPLGTVKTRTRLAGQKLRERLAVLRQPHDERAP
jgi:RNA polymerase sigma-70 factor (ECF subfamily)